MTPPDNPERRSGNTDKGAGEVAPPWQRVARDTGPGQSDQPDSWASGQLPQEDETAQYPAVPADPQANYYAGGYYDGEANGDAATQVVSGTAAGRLFTQEQEPGPPPPSGGVLGGGGVAGAAGGAASGAGPAAMSGADAGGTSSQSTPVSALRRPGRGPRRASLQVKRFDPWSVLKLSLVLGVALFFVWMVAVGVLYTVLDGMGVWDNINGTYTSLVQGEATDGAGDPFITAGRVFGVAGVVGAINIVLISALTTVSAFIYNVSADLSGGLEVTLSERE